MTDDVYQKKAMDLTKKYDSIRRTRPDGNCFFRAFGYAYLEYLLDKKDEYERYCYCIKVHYTYISIFAFQICSRHQLKLAWT